MPIDPTSASSHAPKLGRALRRTLPEQHSMVGVLLFVGGFGFAWLSFTRVALPLTYGAPRSLYYAVRGTVRALERDRGNRHQRRGVCRSHAWSRLRAGCVLDRRRTRRA